MNKKYKVAIVVLLLLVFVLDLAWKVYSRNIAVLSPNWPNAHKERG